jgi:hypothetical protein
MCPRKTTKKAEKQYPPAPSVQDEAGSNEDGDLGRFEFTQEEVDNYLEYERRKELHLENEEEEEYVNDHHHHSSQPTVEMYEQDVPPSLPQNAYRPAARHPSAEPVVVELSQRLPTTPQYHATSESRPQFRHFGATSVIPTPVGDSEAWDQFLREVRRDIDSMRWSDPQPGLASTSGYIVYFPRSDIPDGYSGGLGGLGHNRRPYHSMPTTRTRGSNERVPFAMRRAVDRDLALREEPMELFEMWADTFTASRRIEEDVAILRKRLNLLHKFYYRP